MQPSLNVLLMFLSLTRPAARFSSAGAVCFQLSCAPSQTAPLPSCFPITVRAERRLHQLRPGSWVLVENFQKEPVEVQMLARTFPDPSDDSEGSRATWVCTTHCKEVPAAPQWSPVLEPHPRRTAPEAATQDGGG